MKVSRETINSPLIIELETPEEIISMHAILRQVCRRWFAPTNEIGEPLSERFASDMDEFAAKLSPAIENLYPNRIGKLEL